MTNTYDTSNEPLGSTAVKVLYNNASNLDEAVNSDADTWVDRPPFGRIRRTWRGMENAFDEFLAGTAFELPPLVYVDGTPLQVDRATQLIERSGLLYSVKLPASLPLVLSGTWATDEPLLTVRNDQSLRQDLADENISGGGATLVGFIGRTVAEQLQMGGLTPYNFGAIGDGIADDTVAVQNWAQSPLSHFKYWGDGHFIVKGEVQFRPGDRVQGNGGATKVDFSQDISGSLSCISVTGQLVALPNLAANIAFRDNAVQFLSAHGLKTGDTFLVWNPTDSSWSTWRPDYRAGEWFRVGLVSNATDLTTFGLSYDAYTAGAVQCHKLVGASVSFRDFEIIQPATSNAGLKVSLIDGVTVENVVTGGGIYAGIYIDKCVNLKIHSRATQASSPAAGNNYGLVIGNSQGGTVDGIYYGTRHAVSLGGNVGVGSVCCRNLIIKANYHNLGPIQSQDLHGNTEDITFIGGTFTNGGVLAGKGNRWIGSNFLGKTNLGIALLMGEVKGGDFHLVGCNFDSTVNPNPSGQGIISLLNFTASVTEDTQIIFDAPTFRCPAGVLYPVYAGLNGTLARVSLTFNNPTFNAAPALDRFLRLRQFGATGQFGVIRLKGISGVPSSGFTYVTEEGSPTVSKYQLPSQRSATNVPVTTAASSFTAVTTFAHAYPRAPLIVAGNSNPTVGGKRVVSGYQGATATGFLATIATADAANFASAATGAVTWTAELDEL